MSIRKATIQGLADGMLNAMTNVNGGSTHLNIRDWIFWSGALTSDELAELYQMQLDNLIELYKKNGTSIEEIMKLLPPGFSKASGVLK